MLAIDREEIDGGLYGNGSANAAPSAAVTRELDRRVVFYADRHDLAGLTEDFRFTERDARADTAQRLIVEIINPLLHC